MDVLNERIVEAEFGPLSGDERSMAIEHISKLKGRIRMKDTVFLFDRGYPSKEMIAAILQAGAHFIMRVKRKFNADIDAGPMGSCVVMLNGTRVRVVKFILPSGQPETLITDCLICRNPAFRNCIFSAGAWRKNMTL